MTSWRKAACLSRAQDGRLFDRFRDRLMFPMSDESGHPVAFSGRRISDDPEEPKYLNSPETSIFNKSDLLFHFSEARNMPEKRDTWSCLKDIWT